jgi:hypothetical protein
MKRRGDTDDTELLSREAAAQRLGVSVRTLLNMRRDGRIPADAVVVTEVDAQRVFYVAPILDRMLTTVHTKG